jgi:beta-lactamase regulating signal transducer with metallopeptidase domain
MNKLSQLLSNEISYAIGWTIIHSLWQCTLIALFIAISYAFTKKASAATRYWINSLGLLSCVIASGITFYINYYDSVSIEIASTAYVTEISSSTQQAYVQTISDIINQHINQIVMVWLVGFALYMSKYLAEFFYCQHIKNNHYKNPNQQWQQLFNELKNSVGITQNIQLRLSEIVDIPCVVGHFKPVVLLPASLVLGLSIKQIEVILLHELGHIRRNDYLISSVQTLITLLYFFNPFARWISLKMDEERENACDDIAVAVSGDPLFYANTLKEFAEMKNMYSPAVAMTGRKNLLINRIKRLFIRDTSFTKTYGKAITIMVMFLLTIGYSVAGYSEEKKPTKDTFSIKIENEPLSQLLTLIEQYCPSTAGKVKLKHPDQIISGSFPDFECRAIEHVIRGMDNSLDSTFTGISINEKDIALKNLVAKIESYCPETKGKIQLKNPETLVGFKTENLSCNSIESTVKKLDTDKDGASITIGKIDNITFGGNGPDEYNKAFFKELRLPKEIIDKGYAGNCTLTLTVDTNGIASDITPACISPSEEQKQYFENQLSETAKKTKFPIKMENEKAVIAKGINIKVVWRNTNITAP